ncbi:MAG: type III PLP-dependent enzyme [Shimia sp.]
MFTRQTLASDPASWCAANRPDTPVHFFAPGALSARLRRFQRGFPGDVTFAVKANPAEGVIAQLWADGIDGFDVASPWEIALIGRLCPGAARHYNNPIRSAREIVMARDAGIRSWSVDRMSELRKLRAAGLGEGHEVSVRLKLPVAGAAYDFGEKFGATPEEATRLLARAAALGFTPAMTFHVGTQCADPQVWRSYIATVADIATRADVALHRLNVGGGFPANRLGDMDLEAIFDTIAEAARAVPGRPRLLCEPGRALVADAFALAVPVKAVEPGAVFLSDGLYGGLSELPIMGAPRYTVLRPDGRTRQGTPTPRIAWGPTCDSLDRLKAPLDLPETIAEGDVILFQAMGAYVTGVDTRFNGYGDRRTVTVTRL